MLSIRGGRSLKPFAAIAASVVMAIAIPMTSAFADDHEGSQSKAPKHAPTAPKVLTTFVVDKTLCDAAKAKLTLDLTADKAEDVQEHQAKELDNEITEAQQEAADKALDQQERALLAADRAAIETNCEPKPVTTTACSMAQTKLATAKVADATADKALQQTEKSDSEVEGQNEHLTPTPDPDAVQDAAVKAARLTVAQNCGSAEHGD